jgi:hypothetical protein
MASSPERRGGSQRQREREMKRRADIEERNGRENTEQELETK